MGMSVSSSREQRGLRYPSIAVLRMLASAIALTRSFCPRRSGRASRMSVSLEIILDKLGQPERRRCLMIGDSLRSDIQGARRAGIDSVWMNPRQESAPPSCRPTYEIKALMELIDIVEVKR